MKVKSTVAGARRKIQQEMCGEVNADSGAWRELSTDLKKFLEIALCHLREEHSRQREGLVQKPCGQYASLGASVAGAGGHRGMGLGGEGARRSCSERL